MLNDLSNKKLKEEFKKYQKYYVELLISEKQKHFESVIQNSNNITKTSWSLVNREIGKSGNHTTENHLLINGTIETDQNKIADLFNNYFASVGSSINNQLKNHKYKFRGTPVSGSIFLMPTSKEEIIKIVSSLKNSHAAGYDGLSLDTLKKCIHKIASPLSTIINSHMEDGLFPDEFSKKETGI
ncbi:uncharacterized protein LOC126417047 [Schistocerca serialis cubense]|uniref:uncharacterized protein LOC126417047 n=1 Tax=Schistocerca serialis cubense TaxID=2023355 RepID=UPI00214E5E1C|nr:uncharacterized protein LOC126417047 [Schistocerca serialis cubense]